jgi:tripeptide aminopeptidase
MGADADFKTELLERFLRYVRIHTESDARSETFPSTAGQLTLLRMLADELRTLGVADVRQDEHGYVMALLPSTIPAELAAERRVPAVGWVAHVDTSPDVSGKDVKPQVIERYEGGAIGLPGADDQVIDPAEEPALAKAIGNTLVTSDGTTLLGADDKAGVAEIMTAVGHLIRHPEIQRGPIVVAFTPDEEIGKGTQYFDIERFGAKYAYTLDGADAGCVEFETFSADAAEVTIEGRSQHPGYAKGKMVNAIKLAAEYVARLPQDGLSPERTTGRQGFVHPTNVEGNVQQVVLSFILRDFDTAKLADHRALLERIADEVRELDPRAKVQLEFSETYRNMGDAISEVPFVVSHAEEAIRRAGIEPFAELVRGGTDGARLTAMGVPTPNLFTGGHNYHSRREWANVDEMVKAVEVLIELAKIWAEQGEASV